MNNVFRFLQKNKSEILCLALVMIFFLPMCGFLFRCGCDHIWSGGLSHCNIHNPAPPNCPWCSGPVYLEWLPFLLVCVCAYAGTRGFRRIQQVHWLGNVAGGLVSAFLAATALAWIYATILDYPHFLMRG